MNRHERRAAAAAARAADDAKAYLAVITQSVDWLLEHGATEIRITETEAGGMEVWGNTEGHPAETTTQTVDGYEITIKAGEAPAGDAIAAVAAELPDE